VTDEANHTPLAGTTSFTAKPLSGVVDSCQNPYQQLLITEIL
jgi:hypothetical protein